MVDGADDVRVLGRQGVSKGGRAVFGAVVHGDDLEGLSEAGECPEGFLDQAFEVRLFVVGREEVGESGDAGRGMGGGCVVGGHPRDCTGGTVHFV